MPNPMDISALPFAMLPDFLLTATTTQRYRTSGLSRPNSRLTFLVAAKVTSTEKMPPAGRLYEWFCSPNPLHAITGHNIHDDFGQWQFGGTFLLGNGEIAAFISATGSDPSGLGCWVWFVLSGWTGITTCIISAYCPSDSSLAQANSILAQQCSYLLSQDDPCQPRKAFFCNLGLAISTWQVDGDNIILMADMNGDIQKEEISSFTINLGLQESILAAHPTLLPPISFKQGNWKGKSPIDGVWMSTTLHASAVSLWPLLPESWWPSSCSCGYQPGPHNWGTMLLSHITQGPLP